MLSTLRPEDLIRWIVRSAISGLWTTRARGLRGRVRVDPRVDGPGRLISSPFCEDRLRSAWSSVNLVSRPLRGGRGRWGRASRIEKGGTRFVGRRKAIGNPCRVDVLAGFPDLPAACCSYGRRYRLVADIAIRTDQPSVFARVDRNSVMDNLHDITGVTPDDVGTFLMDSADEACFRRASTLGGAQHRARVGGVGTAGAERSVGGVSRG